MSLSRGNVRVNIPEIVGPGAANFDRFHVGCAEIAKQPVNIRRRTNVAQSQFAFALRTHMRRHRT